MTADALIGYVILGLLVVGSALLVVAISRPIARRLPDSLVVEYVPPSGDIVQHGLALRADRRVLTAAIVAMTVQGKVRLLTPPGARGPVAIEALPTSRFTLSEVSLLEALRPKLVGKRKRRRYLRALAAIGVQVDVPEDGPNVYFLKGRGAFRGYQRRALTKYLDSIREQLKQNGLARKRAVSIHLYLLSLLFLALVVGGGFLTLGAFLNGDGIAALVIIPTVAAVFGVLTIAPPPILRFTEQGHELRRYLSGLRDYVRLTEQERLQMLQSPQGALRTPAGALTPGGQALGLRPQPTAGDPVAQSGLDRYVLTERMLPYAVLFGCERQWQNELEHLGGGGVTPQNLRALGSTVNGVITVLQALLIIIQIVRCIGAVLSIFGRAD